MTCVLPATPVTKEAMAFPASEALGPVDDAWLPFPVAPERTEEMNCAAVRSSADPVAPQSAMLINS